MKAPIKILCGLIALAIGLLLPGIDGAHWITDPMLQAMNAIPLAMIEIVLVCVEPEAFFGAAAAYFLLLTYGYTSMATSRPDAQQGLGLVIMHIIFGPAAVMVGAITAYVIGAFVRKKWRQTEPRGFDVVVSNEPADPPKSN